MATKRSNTTAEVALVPLKSCLVNLPSALVSLLVNANSPAQNVIVELQYQTSTAFANRGNNGFKFGKHLYLGWTGMPSKRRVAPIVNRDGITGTRTQPKDQEGAVVELDSSFGRTLGLSDGQKVGVLLHLDPPIAHTVNIEPLTAADWEIIELHANFLELNLLSQIRALPNPSFSDAASKQAQFTHPLTLHLSPTSTANITITSLSPSPPSNSAFAKIAPDAEVIVAPKVRPKNEINSKGESRSITSTSRKSQSVRSSGGQKNGGVPEHSSRGAVFLRGISREAVNSRFDDEADDRNDDGLNVWVDPLNLAKRELRGVSWICVSVVRPSALQSAVDPQQRVQQKETQSGDAGNISRKLVAKLLPWNDCPDSNLVALSSSLCSSLELDYMEGGVVRVEAAPSPIHSAVKTLKVFPFGLDSPKKKDGLRFGGESPTSEVFIDRFKTLYGNTGSNVGILSGPLTDGMMLPRLEDNISSPGVSGGQIRFDPPIDSGTDSTRPLGWIHGSDRTIRLEIQQAIQKPNDISFSPLPLDETIPLDTPNLVGINTVIECCMSNLSRLSSVLLAGASGSGKTDLCYLLAQKLRKEHHFHVRYFPCRKLLTDETRIPTIKETLQRLFLTAAWSTRLGGSAVIMLDDLDKLTPTETELQVGGENGRSRQISEIVCSTVREYCSAPSSIVLLATAHSKDALNNVIVGGHVVREIISLKAPNKDSRRNILELLTKQGNGSPMFRTGANQHVRNLSSSTQDSWLDPSYPVSRPGSSDDTDGFLLSRDLDFLDLAGKVDGFMPRDLVLLVARARNEALIRSVQESTSFSGAITLGRQDFERGLKGFTPTSLRNVTLTTSSTTFSSIGGLENTRKILLETLQYPTKYAPIFAQCPLRLRSGLLLYGFPGCGKTLLASAVAGECGLNFISVKGPEILNKYIGASEKSVRDLFERAEAARPCILFFDEFDSIAPKRGHDSTGVTDRVVNQLLTQMDGAEGLSGVYVLAATSRPDLIDPALLRPGRLDKSLLCDIPNHTDRVDIIYALSKKLRLGEDVMSRLSEVSERTVGYSGADLQAVIYNAHLEAIHDLLGDRSSSTREDFSNSRTTNGIKPGPSLPSYTDKDSTVPSNGKVSQTSKPFIQFLYDSDQHAMVTASIPSMGLPNSKPSMTPSAVVAAKIEELKKARRQLKLAENGQLYDSVSKSNQPHGDDDIDDKDDGNGDVVIHWSHVERSLGTTRCSISNVERMRLAAIYQEFIVGRNGEMPTGEGGREVGGRTTLM